MRCRRRLDEGQAPLHLMELMLRCCSRRRTRTSRPRMAPTRLRASTPVPSFRVRVPRARLERLRSGKAAAKSSAHVARRSRAAAARRLAAEVGCATSAGASMRHVVLRSSMGCASLEDVSGPPEQDTQEDRALATLAVARMGGVSTIAAQADAEATLRKRCASAPSRTRSETRRAR